MPKANANIAPASRYHNLPLADVVDQLGSLKTQIADLETREKALRDELVRRNVSEAAGAAFDATISAAVRWTLDTKAVKAELGSAWCDARCRQSMVTTVKVEPRAAVLPAIAA
ncbi:MAG TPA: hypothetical protein VHY35_12680 [Stellaceae bacterium]|jgi:hypothetical protein|nr:hypothetical protein [Stellaceae bacterium]